MTTQQDSADVERLQQAWDTCPEGPGLGLPPIIFTEAEARHILAALSLPITQRDEQGDQDGVTP